MMRRSKVESRSFASCPGNRFYIEKHGEVQPNGTIRLIEDKEIDLQEKYNAEYPATTIDNILANSSPLQSCKAPNLLTGKATPENCSPHTKNFV